MYGWLWRKLPGDLTGKVFGSVVLLVGALALLFFVVFPFVEPRLPWNDVTVNTPSVGPSPASSPTASPTAVPSSTAVPSATAGPTTLPPG
jgi:cytoskeletal protein RodZ